MLVIEAPEVFRNSGDLRAKQSNHDPRDPAFSHRRVVIDLSRCQSVAPAAAMWCLVYALLVRIRSDECGLRLPDAIEPTNYLRSTMLLSILSASGADVADRGFDRPYDSLPILALTKFDSRHEVEEAANNASEVLARTGRVAANLIPVVGESFIELANNAVEHADSRIGSFDLIHLNGFPSKPAIVCAVADGGIGIRQSLRQNRQFTERLPFDWVAADLAREEGVTGTGDNVRGFGLFGVAEDTLQTGRTLLIQSGRGIFHMTKDLRRAGKSRLFPGTIVVASIPC